MRAALVATALLALAAAKEVKLPPKPPARLGFPATPWSVEEGHKYMVRLTRSLAVAGEGGAIHRLTDTVPVAFGRSICRAGIILV